jgi:hypothetical protein
MAATSSRTTLPATTTAPAKAAGSGGAIQLIHVDDDWRASINEAGRAVLQTFPIGTIFICAVCLDMHMARDLIITMCVDASS